MGKNNTTPTIMVVDDDEDIRTALKEVLEDKDHTVITAENITDAKNILKNTDEKLQMVITDYLMPDGFGTMLADHILETKKNIRPLIILMSGGDLSKNSILKGLNDNKLHGIFAKPFNQNELLALANGIRTLKSPDPTCEAKQQAIDGIKSAIRCSFLKSLKGDRYQDLLNMVLQNVSSYLSNLISDTKLSSQEPQN